VPAAARDVMRRAREWRARFLACQDRGHVEAALLAADAQLKSRGINPGTSADLTVATLMAWRLGDRCG